MKYLKSDEKSVLVTAEALKNQKIVIIPTDTVYGFSGIVSSCDDESGIDEIGSGCLCGGGKSGKTDVCSGTDGEIRRIKGREAYKPFIQLIAEPDDIRQITDDNIPEELFSLWPGALTIIVNDKRPVEMADGGNTEGKNTAFANAEGHKTTVAVRCPGDAWLRNVIRETGSAIYSTSVNRSGKPVLTDIADIAEEFEKEVELIIDDGDKRNALPSTIVSVCDGSCRIIRQGSVVVPDTLVR